MNYCAYHDIYDCPFAHDPRDPRQVSPPEKRP